MQVANWGCGAESVFDAVSLAEQYACTKNRDDPDAWTFYFRKDLFEPVVNPGSDKVATDLIYHQIIGGIRTGEYVCVQVRIKSNISNRFILSSNPHIKKSQIFMRFMAVTKRDISLAFSYVERNNRYQFSSRCVLAVRIFASLFALFSLRSRLKWGVLLNYEKRKLRDRRI